ncbi:hypothetical protein ADUPG1_006493, partial [Aduncisulcus paluster]
MVSLKRLNLEDNYIDTAGIEDILSGLTHCKSLERLILDGNAIKALDCSLLRDTRIRRLFLDGNKLEDVSGIETLKHLKAIFISNNRLSRFYLQSSSSVISKIEFIDLSFNSISSIKLPRLPNLKVLNLSNNKLTSFPSVEGSSILEVLDLSNNSISRIDNLGLSLPPRLKKLFIAGNPDCHIPKLIRSISFLTDLEKLDVRHTFVDDEANAGADGSISDADKPVISPIEAEYDYVHSLVALSMFPHLTHINGVMAEFLRGAVDEFVLCPDDASESLRLSREKERQKFLFGDISDIESVFASIIARIHGESSESKGHGDAGKDSLSDHAHEEYDDEDEYQYNNESISDKARSYDYSHSMSPVHDGGKDLIDIEQQPRREEKEKEKEKGRRENSSRSSKNSQGGRRKDHVTSPIFPHRSGVESHPDMSVSQTLSSRIHNIEELLGPIDIEHKFDTHESMLSDLSSSLETIKSSIATLDASVDCIKMSLPDGLEPTLQEHAGEIVCLRECIEHVWRRVEQRWAQIGEESGANEKVCVQIKELPPSLLVSSMMEEKEEKRKRREEEEEEEGEEKKGENEKRLGSYDVRLSSLEKSLQDILKQFADRKIGERERVEAEDQRAASEVQRRIRDKEIDEERKLLFG